jgi:hypothetical protein
MRGLARDDVARHHLVDGPVPGVAPVHAFPDIPVDDQVTHDRHRAPVRGKGFRARIPEATVAVVVEQVHVGLGHAAFFPPFPL